jgi:hypothetical protein
MPGNFKLLWTLLSCVSHRISSIRSISWMIHIYYVTYTVNNKHLYTMNVEIHNFNTRYNTNLHPPISNLTKFQKWSYYSRIRTFSHLPANIKCLTNDLEHFHNALKRSLNSNSIYTLEAFLNYNRQPYTFCICLVSSGSCIDFSLQLIITMTRTRKSHSWLLYGCLMYVDK